MNKKLLALYGLKWNPFAPDVPVEALQMTPQIESFCWRVEQLAGEGGFALLTLDDFRGDFLGKFIVPGDTLDQCHGATPSRRPRRARFSVIMCAWPIQGGRNSGRKVITSNTGRLATRSTMMPNNSHELGSIQ